MNRRVLSYLAGERRRISGRHFFPPEKERSDDRTYVCTCSYVQLVASRRREPWERGCKTPTSLFVNFFVCFLSFRLHRKGKITDIVFVSRGSKSCFQSFWQLKEKHLVEEPKVTSKSTASILSHFCLFACTCVCCIHVCKYYFSYTKERRNIKEFLVLK